jgi:UDP-2,3-diacylglucosamine hydrolase
VAAQGAPASALPLPEATPTLALPDAWRAVDFISDLHLDASTPGAFDAWAAHLRHSRADAVFILGDLFEVWIGDDIAERDFEARCTEVLGEAARHRAIAFMAGNRDFLVGAAMLDARRCGSIDPTLPSPEQQVLVRTVTRLPGDVAYQRQRPIVRRPGATPCSRCRDPGAPSATGAQAEEAMKASARPPPTSTDADAAACATAPPGWCTATTCLPAGARAGLVRRLSDWHLDGAGTLAEVLRWTDAGLPDRRKRPAGQHP